MNIALQASFYFGAGIAVSRPRHLTLEAQGKHVDGLPVGIGMPKSFQPSGIVGSDSGPVQSRTARYLDT